jgi:hypothetical protein
VRLRPAAVVRLEGALALAHWSALLVDNRRTGADGCHFRWGRLVLNRKCGPPRGTLPDQGTQRRRGGSNRPAALRAVAGVLWRCVPVASVRLHRWIRGDRL